MMTNSSIHSNLKYLSHSSDELMECPRKYFIQRMRPGFAKTPDVEIEEDDVVENTSDLDFGSILGIGVQEYLLTEDIEQVYWKMFLAWPKELTDESGEKKNKTFWFALIAIDKFIQFNSDSLIDHELVSFNNKPAIELGFSINCGDGWYYRGKLDALLYTESRNSLIPLEVKSTGNYYLHEAMYQNSGQGSGYKLIVDAISKILNLDLKNSFQVIYIVYQTKQMQWTKFPFPKTSKSLTGWLKNLLSKREMLEYYWQTGYWPMNGGHCFSFGKPCKYFGLCDMPMDILLGKNMERVEIRDQEADKAKFEFHFHLENLIQMVMEE